jgi:hypothetical protein
MPTINISETVQGTTNRARPKPNLELIEPEPISPERAKQYAASRRRSIAHEICGSDDPLAFVREAIRSLGYAGDTEPCELVYVALTSRLLDRPLNLLLMGPSSAGKSFTVDMARKLFPFSAYHYVSASSKHAAIYSAENMKHRMLIIAERDSVPAHGAAATALRTLAGCGKTRI